MTCDSTRGAWGGTCPDCGAMLPARREWRGWRSDRIDPVRRAQALAKRERGIGDEFGARYSPRGRRGPKP